MAQRDQMTTHEQGPWRAFFKFERGRARDEFFNPVISFGGRKWRAAAAVRAHHGGEIIDCCGNQTESESAHGSVAERSIGSIVRMVILDQGPHGCD